MIYVGKLAWKQMRHVRGTGLSFMAWTSLLGVTVGVWALILVLSVMGGFGADLREKMFTSLPHAIVMAKKHPMGGFPKNHLDEIQLAPHVWQETFVQVDAVLKSSQNILPITLLGVEPGKGKIWGLKTHKNFDGLFLGEPLADSLGIHKNDDVTIFNLQSMNLSSFLSGQTPQKLFPVEDLYETYHPKLDLRSAVISMAQARRFLPDYEDYIHQEEYISGLAINVQDPEKIDDFLDKSIFSEKFQVKTWKDENHSLLLALALEKMTMSFILFLIVLVAAFAISATTMMNVYYRRWEISLLRALGMSKKEITMLFCFQGAVLGSLGVFFGIALGLGSCWALTCIDSLPILGEHFRRWPVRFLPQEYMIVGLCAWILSWLAALYPALLASKQEPGDGLRYS